MTPIARHKSEACASAAYGITGSHLSYAGYLRGHHVMTLGPSKSLHTQSKIGIIHKSGRARFASLRGAGARWIKVNGIV